jgi:hypothetical protein
LASTCTSYREVVNYHIETRSRRLGNAAFFARQEALTCALSGFDMLTNGLPFAITLSDMGLAVWTATRNNVLWQERPQEVLYPTQGVFVLSLVLFLINAIGALLLRVLPTTRDTAFVRGIEHAADYPGCDYCGQHDPPDDFMHERTSIWKSQYWRLFILGRHGAVAMHEVVKRLCRQQWICDSCSLGYEPHTRLHSDRLLKRVLPHLTFCVGLASALAYIVLRWLLVVVTDCIITLGTAAGHIVAELTADCSADVVTAVRPGVLWVHELESSASSWLGLGPMSVVILSVCITLVILHRCVAPLTERLLVAAEWLS